MHKVRMKMRADIRVGGIAVALAVLALLIPNVAVKIVVLTAITAGLIVAVLVRG
jgi:hypothetical protein